MSIVYLLRTCSVLRTRGPVLFWWVLADKEFSLSLILGLWISGGEQGVDEEGHRYSHHSLRHPGGGVVVALDAGHVTGNEHDAGEDAGHAAGRGPVEEHAKPDPAHTGGSQHQDDAHPVGQQGLQE